MAGKLSGSRLELGLVPLGILGLITLTGVLSFVAEPAQGLSGDGSLLTLVLSTAAQQLPTIICLVAIVVRGRLVYRTTLHVTAASCPER